MRTAWVFPGLGSQRKGMGRAVLDQFPDLCACADEIVGHSVRALCLDDHDPLLHRTAYAQPAMFVVNALSWLAADAEDHPPPDFLAGHSLGEYSALFAAGCFDFATGVRLVRRRGELMGGVTGSMLAVVGLSPVRIEEALAEHGGGDIDLANFNGPDQTVLSGPGDSVRGVREALRRAGAQKCVLLNVAVPAHSRYLAAVADRFAAELESVHFAPPAVPVVANVTARPYPERGAAELLARHLYRPVRWLESMRYLIGAGVTEVRELGPGHVLTGLWDAARRAPAGAGHADRPASAGESRASAPAGSTPDQGHQVVVMSAAGAAALRSSAERLRDHLRDAVRSGRPPRLADVAYTSQTGRVAMAHRLVVECADLAGLLAALTSFAEGRPAEGVSHAVVDVAAGGRSSTVDTCAALGTAAVAAAWLAGGDVDWDACWPEPATRIPLPTYPFGIPEDPAEARPDDGGSPDGAARRDRLVAYLCRVFGAVSGLPAAQVHPDLPLERYGLTSLMITQLNDALERELGETSRTLFFAHPTLGGIATELAARVDAPPARAEDADGHRPAADQEIGDRAAAARPAVVPTAPRTGPGDAAIAVIGMAGRYPLASTVEEFWANLAAGRDCVGPLPADRRRPGWPVDLMWGGFLDGVELFDPMLFQITPRDAALMDPQERLFLEVVWEALENAGYSRTRLRECHASRVSVYAGSMYNEYPFFGVERSLAGHPADCGTAIGSIANRVSYFFDLHGPSMTVDTLCSSSLTAVHLAVRGLRQGEAELAVVGAVNLSLHPNKFRQQRRMKLTATDRRSHSFGAGGDGFVPAEAVGAVVLKPLRAARADGDRVRAVIRGTAVVHAGRTNGYIVPSPVAQGELVRAALADAAVDPATIGYLEAHGAGTALGDPIEVDGLCRAFAPAGLPPGSVPIGSVKSGIGHVEAAAGLAGLTKAVLQLEHRQLVPSLHAEKLNPGIRWDEVPFRVQRTLTDWPAPRGSEPGPPSPRRAGISSFGAGGTITHVVLEEAEPAPRPTPPTVPRLVVLSAYDGERLRIMARRLAGFLRPDRDAENPHRAAVDPSALVQELERIAAGIAPPSAPDGRPLTAVELVEHLLRRRDGGDRPLLLGDVAWTLQVGREELRERLALVCTDVPELVRRLEAFLAGDGAGALTGRALATPVAGTPRAPGGGGDEAALAELGRHWVSGGRVDWPRLYEADWAAGAPPQIVSLPSYPFARLRCWLDEPPPAVSPAETPLYTKVWEPAAHPGAAPPADGSVLVCVADDRSAPLVTALACLAGSVPVLTVRPNPGTGPGGEPGPDERHVLDVIRSAPTSGPAIVAWIDLGDLESTGAESSDWWHRLGMLQRVVALRRTAGLRVLHLTRGLADLAGAPASLAGARLGGFVRALGAEYPRVVATTLDVGDAAADEVAGLVLAESARTDRLGEACYHKAVRYEPRLRPVSVQHEPLRLTAEGTYLVTGGTRGLGARVARRLAARGARHLALLGARPLPNRAEWSTVDPETAGAEAVGTVRALEGGGARVHIHTGSLTDRDALGAFLAEVRAQSGPIRGVVHCAGGLGGGRPPFAHRTGAELRAVLEPKADGLMVLAELCEHDPVDFFLLFSSICAAVPRLAAGALDYAAANAFMDYYVGYRRRLGPTPLRSVNWPMWRDSGSGRGQANVCAPVGLASLGDDEALRVLERVVALPGGAVIVPCPPLDGQVDPDGLVAVGTAAGPVRDPEPGGVAAPEPAAAPAVPGDAAVPVRAVPGEHAPPAEQPDANAAAAGGESPVPGWLVDVVAETLGVDPGELDVTAGFGDLGVESVMLGELLGRIEDRAGRPLEPSTLLDYASVERLAGYFARARITSDPAPTGGPSPAPTGSDPSPAPTGGPSVEPPAGTPPPGPPVADAPARHPDPSPTVAVAPAAALIPSRTVAAAPAIAPALSAAAVDGRVAVIGMAGRFPGARDVATFWQNLVGGRCSVTEVPASRWDADRLYRPTPQTGTSLSRWGGFLDGIEDFDAEYFGLTDAEARAMDPAIRLVLESTATCLADAGYPAAELRGAPAGVFVGGRTSGYTRRAGVHGEILQSDPNFLAAHVAHRFDLRGPNLVVDTACSSGLVAVGLAMRSLLTGDCELALAGGVEVLLDEQPYLEFSAARALSPTGRCHAFDERADGFVPGEGCGVVLLKPLRAALTDGDRIYGVIESVAINNDGHTMGTTTPSPVAQAAVVRAALAKAGRGADEFGLVEAHGTGTLIGDPIELRALTDVFRESTDQTGGCAIGSVKSNVGHLLCAAGVAGLIKALLAVQHAQLPPTLHCDTPNPRFDFAGSPFYPNPSLRDWPRGLRPPVAGVSSFGLGGTNAHAVVAALDVARHGAARPPRSALPPPGFRRRRLWLEPRGAEPVDGDERFVSGILELEFR